MCGMGVIAIDGGVKRIDMLEETFGSKTPTRLAKKLAAAVEDNGPSDPSEVMDQSISESVTSSPATEGLVVNYTSDLEEGEAKKEEDEGEDVSGAPPPPSSRSTATAPGPISEPLASQTVAGPENAAETVAAVQPVARTLYECLTPRMRVRYGIDVAGTTGAVQAAQQRGLRPRQPPPLSRGPPPPPPRAARVLALVESQDGTPLDAQAGTDLETAGTMPPVPAPTNVPPTLSTPPATQPAPAAPEDDLESPGGAAQADAELTPQDAATRVVMLSTVPPVMPVERPPKNAPCFQLTTLSDIIKSLMLGHSTTRANVLELPMVKGDYATDPVDFATSEIQLAEIWEAMPQLALLKGYRLEVHALRVREVLLDAVRTRAEMKNEAESLVDFRTGTDARYRHGE